MGEEAEHEGGTPDVSASGPGAVRREVELDGDVGEVWEALTDEAQVASWFGAPVRWELRPGGPVQVGVPDDAGARAGEVDEVDPGRRLRFRWWPLDDDGSATTVTYELEPVPGGTRLVVTEAAAQACATSTLVGADLRWDARAVLLHAGLWVGLLAGSPLVRA